MISERRRIANRRNARRGSGPRSKEGKSRSSQNALRHGLNTVHRSNPIFEQEIGRVARALCGGSDDPLLLEQAIVIAECDLILRMVHTEEVAAIERLRDPAAVSLGKRNATLAQGRALFAELEIIGEEHSQYPGRFFPTAVDEATFASRPPPMQLWQPAQPRAELDAISVALPELRRLQRYGRRAWSQKMRAMRTFIAIKSGVSIS